MNNSQLTPIQYFIPEDKDDSDKFNVFMIYKDIDSVRYNDIKESFPLPGTYYFRFKFKLNNQVVWIDLTNMNAPVPRFENKIIVKVSRISWTNEPTNEQENPNLI